MSDQVAVEIVEEAGIHVLELIHPGPQGPPGAQGTQGPTGPAGPSGDATGLPAGGDPGNILMKSSYANYESNWAPTLDGGTFN
jgi:hypothetical protein